jgi:D-alanine-D-alanine ligase
VRQSSKKFKVLVLHNRAAGREGEHLSVLAAGLAAHGFDVVAVDAEDDFSRISHAAVVERPDLVFNLVTQFRGDSLQHPNVASLLELLGLPYTGSDPLCLSTCQDRLRTHLLLGDAGVPVPPYVVVRDIVDIPPTAAIGGPLVVSHVFDDLYDEPSIRTLVMTRGELEERARELAAGAELPLLVERYVGGRRFHAVLLGNRTLEVLPLGERAVASDGTLGPVVVARLPVDVADGLRAIAQRAFRVMDCRDCAQIDFAVGDDDGIAYVLGVRPVFDMFPGSPFVIGAAASALGVEGAIAHLADIALGRSEIEHAEAAPAMVPSEDAAPLAVPDVLATGTQQIQSQPAPPDPGPESPVAPPATGAARKKRAPHGPQRKPAAGGRTRQRLETSPVVAARPAKKPKKPAAPKKTTKKKPT